MNAESVLKKLDHISVMHPAAVEFMMDQIENMQDFYSGLTSDIESAYAFFLD